MLVTVRRCLLSGILPFKIFDEDEVLKTSKTAQSYNEQTQENETGWDRLNIMFSRDEFGKTSPELHSSLQATFYGLFIGACYGGFIRSKTAYIDFMERNQATVYKTPLEAKKKLQDHVTLSFAKGAAKWAWRLGAFTGGYALISTSISVYRGKSSVWEYIIAGSVTGACFKINMGPRGMLVGGLLGTCLGTVAGGVTLVILKTSGMTMEEVRYWQYRWKDSQTKYARKVAKEIKARDEPPLLTIHNERFGSTETNLESDRSQTTIEEQKTV